MAVGLTFPPLVAAPARRGSYAPSAALVDAAGGRRRAADGAQLRSADAFPRARIAIAWPAAAAAAVAAREGVADAREDHDERQQGDQRRALTHFDLYSL